MKLSVCIPNYNYARFLGKTIESVLQQSDAELEVLVSDNASTDGSTDVVKSFDDDRVKLGVNRCNVGFAGNLDRVVRMASGEHVILLSSDDLMRPEMLATYTKLYEHLGEAGDKAIVTTTQDIIDPEDNITGHKGPDKRFWKDSDRSPELEKIVGAPVYRVEAAQLLGRCLRVMTNPLNLSTSAWPRGLYDMIEGYGGGRVINPDKWYHWRLLGVAEAAYFIDRPLAASRWHPANQTALQTNSGALKYLVDEYVTTFQIDDALLERAGITRTEFEKLFVEFDIGRHGLATLGAGNRAKAKRILAFGAAAYPAHARRNQSVWALRALLAAGPIGQLVSKAAYKVHLSGEPRGAAS